MYNPFTFDATHIELIHNHFHDDPYYIKRDALESAVKQASNEIWNNPTYGAFEAAGVYAYQLIRSNAFGRQSGDTALVCALLFLRLYGHGFVCTQQYLYNFVERHADPETMAICLSGAYAGAESYVESLHLQQPHVPMDIADIALDEDMAVSLTSAIKMAYDVNGDYGACQKIKKPRLSGRRKRWVRLADL
ncbi:MAG: death-on-curing protein [Pseudomonadota bacterium]|nr:death-on-curing protein [Idiomarina sp.]MEC7643121.1 death-on-curing protein [Pseudomonadota bacterium]NQZ15342.1 death-on-curing protein [Idiomarina sp.]